MRAIGLMEEGQMFIWKLLRKYRDIELAALEASYPELAARFIAISKQLRKIALVVDTGKDPHSSSSGSDSDSGDASMAIGPRLSFEHLQSIIRTTRDDWPKLVSLPRQLDQLLASIRNRPGFESFYLPGTNISYGALKSQLSVLHEGPVVVLNVTQGRSDALIICESGSNDPIHVCLDPSTNTEIGKLYDLLHPAIDSDMESARNDMLKIFRKTWELVMKPIVLALESPSVRWPTGQVKHHIWLMSTSSQLIALPLHVSGPYKSSWKTDSVPTWRQRHSDPDNIFHRYMVSYTPSLTSLVASRKGYVPIVLPAQYPERLIMAPESKHSVENERLLQEIKSIENTFLGTSWTPARIIRTDEHAQIMSALTHKYRWLHFSGHTVIDCDQPFASGFIISNDGEAENPGLFTMQDILDSGISSNWTSLDVDLAFLSSCNTAVSHVSRTPTEKLTMEHIGFRSVVGTMWEAFDLVSQDISGGFYKKLIELSVQRGRIDVRDMAEALDYTISRLRNDDRFLAFPRHFCAHVHIGL